MMGCWQRVGLAAIGIGWAAGWLTFPTTCLATEPGLRIVTAGWNQPTQIQAGRDASDFAVLPIDGSVLSARFERPDYDLFSAAHSATRWGDIQTDSVAESFAQLDPELASGCYLAISANPGDVDFFDDVGWKRITDHWRLAAQCVAKGKLRGLAFDPEAYQSPHSQFRYSAQPQWTAHSFDQYAAKARQRGEEVARAIAGEVPHAEILCYFLMSFLVEDRLSLGPSPVNVRDGERRRDFAWCLAGHRYGLLPAFLSGMLAEAPPSMVFYDGCEYGYWMQSDRQMTIHARRVRDHGRMIVDADVRQKYARQVKLAFPVFMDLIVKDLIPQWTLSPQQPDRLAVLSRQLRMARGASDGLIWIYGERGRWWPEAKQAALWPGKDTYPSWETRLPGCSQTISEFRLQPVRDGGGWGQSTIRHPGRDLPVGPWQAGAVFSQQTTSAAHRSVVEIENETIRITGPGDGAAHCRVPVEALHAYRLQCRAKQHGNGMMRLVVHFEDAQGKRIKNDHSLPGTPRSDLFFSYPIDSPRQRTRTIRLRFETPTSAATAVVETLVTDQRLGDDEVQFYFSGSGNKMHP